MENFRFKMILSAAACCCAFSLDAQDPERKPNVLFIQCDQQRFDCLGYNGNKLVSTPNIDALAEKGMQFQSAYSPIPTSCPARQCLLSGLWASRHGGLWNYGIALPVRLFESDTWTERMQESGYNMGYVGKWHVHPKKNPTEFGFDDYVGYEHYSKWAKENHIQSKETMNTDSYWMGGYTSKRKEDDAIHWLVRKAIALIQQYEKEGKPWHVRLDYSEPHLPCFPVKEFYDKFKDVKIPEWENFKEDFKNKPHIQYQQVLNWGLEDYTWKEWEQYMRSYFASTSQTDDAIGILVRELEKMGIMENTIVIYTADHGDAAGSHRMIDKHYVMYEEEVHVPLLIRWDGHIEAGSQCDEFVITGLDLAETMNSLAGLDMKTQGMSLLPLMKGEKNVQWRQYAFSEYNGQQFGLFVERMIRDHRYKYVWHPTDIDEFYDLENDPYEKVNCIHKKKYAAEITRLRKALYDDLRARKDPVARSWFADKQLLEEKTH